MSESHQRQSAGTTAKNDRCVTQGVEVDKSLGIIFDEKMLTAYLVIRNTSK